MYRWAITVTGILAMFCLGASPLAAPIHDAAGKGDLAKVKALVAKDAKLINVKDGTGATPLHFAVAGSHKAVVEYLLSKKADVNAKKKDGVTPLHIAASLGKVEIAKLLLAKGAKKDAADSKGRTPLTLAGEKGHVEMIGLLSGKAPSPKPGVKIISIPKDAVVMRAGKKLAGVTKGTELKLGDVIENGKTGDLIIHIGDISAIRLKPGAKLKLTKLTLAGDLDIRTDLQAGDALSRVKALTGQSRFQMASPGAVVAVKGTAFALKVKGEESTVIVGEGKVGVSLPSDPASEVEVLENERLVVKAGSLGQPEPVTAEDSLLIVEMLNESLPAGKVGVQRYTDEPEVGTAGDKLSPIIGKWRHMQRGHTIEYLPDGSVHIIDQGTTITARYRLEGDKITNFGRNPETGKEEISETLTWRVTGDILEMTDAKGTTARFELIQDSTTGPNVSGKTSIVGKWRGELQTQGVLEFKADGTFEGSDPKRSFSGTYTIAGNVLTARAMIDGKEIVSVNVWEIVGDTFLSYDRGSDRPARWHRVR